MFKRKKEKISLANFFVSIILLFVFFAIIFSLASANIKIKKRRAEIILRTEMIEKEIETIRKISEELENDIAGVDDDDYLEQVAREKLGLKLEGEEVVFITREKEETEEVIEKEKETEGWKNRIKDLWNFFK